MHLGIVWLFAATAVVLVFRGTGGVDAAPVAAPSYTVVDLGTLPGDVKSSARDINNTGQVVGVSVATGEGDVSARAVLWNNGQAVALGALPGETNSVALAINDVGQVVGSSGTMAVLWQGGQITNLGTLSGYPSSVASGINNSGQVVGAAFNISAPGQFASRAVLWQNGQIIDLGTLPGDAFSAATAINERSQIVGWSADTSSRHAVLWQNGQIIDLGLLPRIGVNNSTANGVNAQGQIVGTASGGGVGLAVRWDNGQISELPENVPGSSAANEINDVGQSVGSVIAETGGPAALAVVWQPGSTNIQPLPNLPVQSPFLPLSHALAINNFDQIVGDSATGPGPDAHAVLWQPAIVGATPTTTATLTSPPNGAGWERSNVLVTLSATAAAGGLPVQTVTYSATGAQSIASTTVQGNTTQFTISAEGTTTVSYFAVDQAGNKEQVKTLVIKIDKTPPSVTCQATPSTLWPPNGKLVDVQVNVSVTDPNGSGPSSFMLVAVTSSQANSNRDGDNDGGDIQGWLLGTADTSGQLRADRDGAGRGLIYGLTYEGSDIAGNIATCTTTVMVPHDRDN